MPKWMDTHGDVWKNKERVSDIPVTVFPTADWQRLVALLRLPIFRLLLKKMQPELAEIDTIIARTEATNE